MASKSDRARDARVDLLAPPKNSSIGPSVGRINPQAIVPTRAADKEPAVSRFTAQPARSGQPSTGRLGPPTATNQPSGSGRHSLFISPVSKRVSLSTTSKETKPAVIVISSDEDEPSARGSAALSSKGKRNGPSNNHTQQHKSTALASSVFSGRQSVTAGTAFKDTRKHRDGSSTKLPTITVDDPQGSQPSIPPDPIKTSRSDLRKEQRGSNANAHTSAIRSQRGSAIADEILHIDPKKDQGGSAPRIFPTVDRPKSQASALSTQKGLQPVIASLNAKNPHSDPKKDSTESAPHTFRTADRSKTASAPSTQQGLHRVNAPLNAKNLPSDPKKDQARSDAHIIRTADRPKPPASATSTQQGLLRGIASLNAKNPPSDPKKDQAGSTGAHIFQTAGRPKSPASAPNTQQGLQRVFAPTAVGGRPGGSSKDLKGSNGNLHASTSSTRQSPENTSHRATPAVVHESKGSSSTTCDKGKSKQRENDSDLSSRETSGVVITNIPNGQAKKRRFDLVDVDSAQVQRSQSDQRRNSGPSIGTTSLAQTKALSRLARRIAAAPKQTSNDHDISDSTTTGRTDQLLSFTAIPLPRTPPRRRAESPDWSKIPSHRRPYQGRERPDEFETSLQSTWLTTKKPDVTTSLAQMIYREEINSRQMWENPDIPKIEVIIPDTVKSVMMDKALSPPFEFVYTERIVYRTQEKPVTPRWQCSCRGDCRNSATCECRAYQEAKIHQLAGILEDHDYREALKNWTGFAYKSDRKPMHSHRKTPDNADPEARVVEPCFLDLALPIFECNDLCGCGPDCLNRTVGRGRREKLNLEKTLTRGWGVFTNNIISQGRLVTHYSGELITGKVSDERSTKLYDQIGRTYVFDLDPWWIQLYGGKQELDDAGFIQLTEQPKPQNSVEYVAPVVGPTVESLYVVDAFWFGNISRFVNHSCDPNTSILPIYINDNDHTRPIFAMFAKRPIKNGEEVTTSYSDPTDDHEETPAGSQETNEHKMGRDMQCNCGAKNCKRFMFSR